MSETKKSRFKHLAQPPTIPLGLFVNNTREAGHPPTPDLGSSITCSYCCYVLQKRVNISRWPAVTGQGSATQDAWPPIQRPPPVGARKLYPQAPAEAITRAPQSQASLRQQRPQDFQPPEEPARFSPGKGQSTPVLHGPI